MPQTDLILVDPTTLVDFWHAALNCEIGLFIATSEPKPLLKKLYKARSDLGLPMFDELIIFAPASNDCLLIAKKSVELDP